MKFRQVFLFILLAFLAGCAQTEVLPTAPQELKNPFKQPLEPPKVNLKDFEFEFTSIGDAKMVTVLFQKNNLTKTIEGADNVLEIKSKEISQKELEDLTNTVYTSFLQLEEQEYGSFIEGNGPTYVLEIKIDGEKKVVSCQMNCPEEIKNIAKKVQPYLDNS